MSPHPGKALRNRHAAVLLPAMLALAGCQALGMKTTPAADADAARPSMKAARTALAEGEAETALGIATGVLAMEPKNVAALVQAGDAEVQLDNHLNAERDYRHALEYDPSNVPARIGMAKLKLRDDPKGAEVALRSILASSPRDPSALTDLGVALDLQERHKEAQAEYLAALAVNPDLAAPRVNLGVSLALSGDAAQAEQMLHDAAAQSGTVAPKVRADFALAQVMAGHADQAEQTLQADLSADDAKVSVEGMQALMPVTK